MWWNECERNKLTCWLITGEFGGLVWIFRWLWHSHHIKHESIQSLRTVSSVRPPCDVTALPPRFCWDDSAAETTTGRILLTWHTRTQRKDTHMRTSRILSSEGVIHQRDCSCLKLQVHESQSHSESQKGLMFMLLGHQSLLYPETRIYWISCQITYDNYCTGWKSPREIMIRSTH